LAALIGGRTIALKKKLARLAFAALALALALGSGPAPIRAQTPGPQESSAPQASPGAASLASAGLPPAAADLYRRLTQLNAQLRTYKAKLNVTVVLRTFLPLSKTLEGTVYYRRPDRQAVVFDTVPALAKEFQKVYPRIEAPVEWPRVFAISSLGSEGGVTTFRLVPLKHGRIVHLDVRVSESNATIAGYTWTYEDGGDVAFDQTFVEQSGFQLVSGQVGRVNLPAYKADVTSTIGGYQLNVPLADSIFDPAAK
jgi:hypothetical protein